MNQILFAQANTDGINLNRIVEPAKYIEGARILPLGFQEIPEGYTHIVFNSVFTYAAGKQEQMLKVCRNFGLKIVLDIDDNWHLSNTHFAYTPKYAEEVDFCIKNADIVWCASKKLYLECKKLNKNSHYIPNAATNRKAQPKGKGQKFGYVASATNHLQDAELLSKTFQNLAKDKLPGAQVCWSGFEPTKEGNKMLELFSSAGNYALSHYSKGIAYWWHYANFDTALAPLVKNNFNSYKSALKGIEAGAMGCAFICSDFEPYEVFTHKTDCLKAGSKSEWWSCFTQLYNDPELALAISENLQELVFDLFDPKKINAERIQTLG